MPRLVACPKGLTARRASGADGMDVTLLLKTLLIGVIEGLTEFVPVSSTGHIILAEEVLDFKGPSGKVFEIVIQLGAILAICVLYRIKISSTIVGVLNREQHAIRFATAVIVAFLPTAVVGVAAHKYIKLLLGSPMVVAVALIVGGIEIY
jgi:undecaprenyl-diphosphatase